MKYDFDSKRSAWTGLTLAVLGGMGMAAAQAAEPAAATGASAATGTIATIEEIVITSQKRAQAIDVQKVSTSVTAFDGRMLEQNFTIDLTDIGRLSPNTQLNQSGTFPGFANFFIRGVGSSNTIRTADPAVGTFVDGIYIGFGPTSILSALDLGSVEVLRGPQGTLFGKNVSGGAVVVNTQRPTNEFGGKAKVTVGNYNRIDASAAVNVPIVDEKLAARFVAATKSQDGFYKNLENGQTKGDTDVNIFRGSLRWTPNDALDMTLIGEYYKDRGGSAGSQNMDSRNNPRQLLVGGVLVPTPATVQRVFGYTPPADKYDVRHDLQGYIHADVYSAILDANYDLGHGVATLVTGYRDVTFNSSTDFDGSPFKVFQFPDNRESQNQYSAELRYASTFSDWYDFTVGLYYFTQKMRIGERREFFAGGTAANPVIAHTAGLALPKDSSYAAFGQGNIHVLDNLSLVLGARYTYEKKKMTLCPFTAAIYDSLSLDDCPATIDGKDSWTSFSPKIGLEWQATPEIMGYASWTKGSRSGSYNARATNLPSFGPVDQETVSSFEGGFKSMLFDRRVRFNAAAYLSDYKDIQRTVSDTVMLNGIATVLQIPRNAASATIWGFEIEAQAAVTEGLTLDASVGYTNASYDEFLNIDANRNGVYEPAIDGPLASSLEFERVPEWQFAVGASYEWSLGDYGSMRARTSYAWVDKQFIDTLNSPTLKLHDYGLLDASLTFISPNERYEVSLYGRNLTNADYYDFGFDGGTHRAVWGGVPRTWGVELSASF